MTPEQTAPWLWGQVVGPHRLSLMRRTAAGATLGLVLWFLVAHVCTVHGGTIGVAWDPVAHEDLAGYRVLVTHEDGTASTIDTPPVTEFTVAGLADCTTYRISVKAFDADGDVSAHASNEVAGWPRPRLDAVEAVAVPDSGATEYVIPVTGANFQVGATAEFAASSIEVTSIDVTDCNTVELRVQVPADAPRGELEFVIVNPDLVYGLGVLPVGFSIVPNVRRADMWGGFGN